MKNQNQSERIINIAKKGSILYDVWTNVNIESSMLSSLCVIMSLSKLRTRARLRKSQKLCCHFLSVYPCQALPQLMKIKIIIFQNNSRGSSQLHLWNIWLKPSWLRLKKTKKMALMIYLNVSWTIPTSNQILIGWKVHILKVVIWNQLSTLVQ